MGGCSVIDQGFALKEAIDSGKIEGITKADIPERGLSWTCPDSHKGEFSRVDILNVVVLDKQGGSENWSAIVGLPRGKKDWEVIYVSKQISKEQWRALSLQQDKQ